MVYIASDRYLVERVSASVELQATPALINYPQCFRFL